CTRSGDSEDLAHIWAEISHVQLESTIAAGPRLSRSISGRRNRGMGEDKPKPPTIEELEAQGLAPWKRVGQAEPYIDEQILYGHIKGFFETFVYFQDRRYYDVATAWTLHTWHIRRWRATGPLLLIGPVNSGKTTVLE